MKIKYVLILLVCFGISACQSSSTSQSVRTKNANETRAVTNLSKVDKQIAEAQKAAANSAVVQAKYYPGSGIITQIKKNTGEVELQHDEIRGKAPAGKKMFFVKNPDQLKDMKVGERVGFVLEDDSGEEQLSTIYKPSQMRR